MDLGDAWLRRKQQQHEEPANPGLRNLRQPVGDARMRRGMTGNFAHRPMERRSLVQEAPVLSRGTGSFAGNSRGVQGSGSGTVSRVDGHNRRKSLGIVRNSPEIIPYLSEHQEHSILRSGNLSARGGTIDFILHARSS